MTVPARPRVLHVTEAYGGGVASAIADHVRATPESEHHLLRTARSGATADGDSLAHFASVTDLPVGARAARQAIRRRVREVRPAVLHAHSSYAGAFVRTAVLRGAGRPRIVYTPHCYAFERGDQPWTRRAAFRIAETLLSWNTDVVAACSDRERTLARRLRRGAAAVHVPNVAAAGLADAVEGGARDATRALLVAGGRFCPQKDPDFFAIAVSHVRARFDVDAAWVGGPAGAAPPSFVVGRVACTGWLPRVDAVRAVADATVYLHTAAWEGFPMAVLEASALSVPIVARDIPVFAGAPTAWVAADPVSVAAAVARLLRDPAARRRNLEEWRRWLSTCTPDTQRAALREAYWPGGAPTRDATPPAGARVPHERIDA